MIRAIHHFPQGFLWGTATSSHQVEGNNTNNDWWAWEQEAGRIHHGQRSGLACDWWGGRWREDLDRAADDGQSAHRLSIEWSRVEPSPAAWDEDALDQYRQIIRGALDRGLMPMVTLHHFTNPAWVAEQGGWLNPEIVPRFERYVRKVVSSLEDLVGLWVTINEPNVYVVFSFLTGHFPPGEKSMGGTVSAARNMVRAHAAAYHAIHEIQSGALVGLAHHYRGMAPHRAKNPLDRWAARIRSKTFNDLFPRAFTDGRFRFLSRREFIPQAARTQDFIGLNYYSTERVVFDPRKPAELFGRSFYRDDADLSPTGFVANEPTGMWAALRWARKSKLPIYITENGIEDDADRIRPRYLAKHVRQVWRAANFNWQVKGYFHWSLIDNFEWERGWTQRWGLCALDPTTQERKRRPSADLYREICNANGISSEMVARYAPEVLEEMFPGPGSPELKAENS